MSDDERYIWWLSFCDPDRPVGDQFLGVALVVPPFDNIGAAVIEAHRLGCNPGGEVSGRPHAPVRYWPADAIGKLLTKDEALTAEGKAQAKHEAERKASAS